MLIVRAMLDEKEFEDIAKTIPDDRKLPRFRFHYFLETLKEFGLLLSLMKLTKHIQTKKEQLGNYILPHV